MKDIMLKIIGRQFIGDDAEDNIEFVTSGQFFAKDGANYIVYKESELLGFPGCMTTLKLSDGAGKPADWDRMPAISAEDIQKGVKLQAELLQPANEPTDRLLLRLSAEAGRGLLTAVDEGLPSIAGPRTARVRRFILHGPSPAREVGFLPPGNVLSPSGQKAATHRPPPMNVARHSWASIARSLDIPVNIISEGMGHHTERTTHIYLSALDANRIDTMNATIIQAVSNPTAKP